MPGHFVFPMHSKFEIKRHGLLISINIFSLTDENDIERMKVYKCFDILLTDKKIVVYYTLGKLVTVGCIFS